jgi:hypothetical protein
MKPMERASRPKIISMWSAPRSLSTVLLYSFAQHSRCRYFDEPFLWHYLKTAESFDLQGVKPYLESDLADAEKQYASLFTCEPGKTFDYVKNMAYQWKNLDETWPDRFTNAFLIRSPEKMVASYLKNCATCCADDFALDKLWEIYQRTEAQGQPAPVIDADDLLNHPELILKALCRLFGIHFEETMLNWQPGPLPGNITLPGTWYDDVMESTGFRKPASSTAPVQLDRRHRTVADQMKPLYEKLHNKRLTPEKAKQVLSNE